MNSCCHPQNHANTPPPAHQHTHQPAKQRDLLLIGSASVLALAVFGHLFFADFLNQFPPVAEFAHSVTTFLTQIWWGVAVGIAFAGLLAALPTGVVAGVLGRGNSWNGLLRATGAGLLLDVCSHGILFIGMQLYRQGASYGQVIAFLVASPWNSFSLTLILWGLIGLPLTLGFIGLSLVIALVAGAAAEWAVRRGYLPANPNAVALPADFWLWPLLQKTWREARFSLAGTAQLLWQGLQDSRAVLRWILFGAVLSSAVRAGFDPATFQSFFGPTLAGLGLTLVVATVLEVCSEGSVPLAADLVTRAAAPGNAFAFLMAGVATDYTELAALRATTGSWKLAFFLPLVTLPQVIGLSWLLNHFAG